MKLLITGVSGYIGSRLLPKLEDRGEELIVLVRSKNNVLTNKNTKYVHIDESGKWMDEIRRFSPEGVIHLASYLTSSCDFESIKKITDVNITFASQILESLKGTMVKFFINTGTFAEYSFRPLSSNVHYYYSLTKTLFRQILDYFNDELKMGLLNVVPFSVYGPLGKNKKIFDLLLDSSNISKKLYFSPGEQVLDFIHVDDVVAAYISVLDFLSHFAYNTTMDFYVGTGKGISIRQLALTMETSLGIQLNIEWGSKDYRKNDTMYAVAPLELNDKRIIWNPTISIENGIEKVYKGY